MTGGINWAGRRKEERCSGVACAAHWGADIVIWGQGVRGFGVGVGGGEEVAGGRTDGGQGGCKVDHATVLSA